jgi:4-hydroxy-tetrahydrodipicolinate synthase
MPVHEDFSIDVERFMVHARWLLEQGCHGLALFGTTSEANSFSVDERMALLEAALAAGIEPERLMVGTGCCALTDSERLTRHAVDNGCLKVLMLPPFYYKGVSDAGLYRSYATVIDRIGNDDLRVLFYHFPKLSGVPITAGLIELLLADYPGIIAGLKDSSGDWSNTADLIERFPEMSIFPGSERYLLQGLRHGGAGCITATANVNAAGARGVWDARRRTQRAHGRRAHSDRSVSTHPRAEVPARPTPQGSRLATGASAAARSRRQGRRGASGIPGETRLLAGLIVSRGFAATTGLLRLVLRARRSSYARPPLVLHPSGKPQARQAKAKKRERRGLGHARRRERRQEGKATVC